MSGVDSTSKACERCLEPGTKIGTYVVQDMVGVGGMGEVYRARHATLKRTVAIKILAGWAADKPDHLARFMREGEFASRLDHPNVVSVMDIGEHEGAPYVVMEYLHGETLRQRIERDGPLSVEPLVDIMVAVCAGVSAAHAEGVVHRDLKPANILLATTAMGEETPKVLDFGISKSIFDDGVGALTTSRSFVGTPAYMSPQQARGAKQVTMKCDQYALGVILYEMATKCRPYEDVDSFLQIVHAIAGGEFKPPRAVNPDVPAELEAVILRAMSFKPEDRYPTVIDLGAALLPFGSEITRKLWEVRLSALRNESRPLVDDSLVPPRRGDDATTTAVTRSRTTTDTRTGTTSTRRVRVVAASAVALGLAFMTQRFVASSADQTTRVAPSQFGQTASATSEPSSTRPVSRTAPAANTTIASAAAPATEGSSATAATSASARAAPAAKSPTATATGRSAPLQTAQPPTARSTTPPTPKPTTGNIDPWKE